MSREIAIAGSNGTALAHPASATMPAGAKARGIMPEQWHVLSTVLFKDAAPEMILTLVDYCKARKLDPLKKPFHIVKVWDTNASRMVDTIWPGIGELRTTAMRTGDYAGKSECVYGPDKTKRWGNVEVTFPEWAQCSVFRMVGGQRVEFAGERVYWLETYAGKKSGEPNAMWQKRPRGQLGKCAEAEALRAAFPEEIGQQYTAEEMEGQSIGADRALDVTPRTAAPLADPADTVAVYDEFGQEEVLAPAEVAAWAKQRVAEATDEGLEELLAQNGHAPAVLDAVEAEKARRAAKANRALPLFDADGVEQGTYPNATDWLAGLEMVAKGDALPALVSANGGLLRRLAEGARTPADLKLRAADLLEQAEAGEAA